MSDIQTELDKAEEFVLTKLIGNVNNPIISNKIQIFCIMRNIDIPQTINEYINKFEELSKPFMTEEGYYDGKKLSSALALKYPSLTGLEIPTMRPIELFTILDSLIGFDSIGNIIQNL